MLCEEVGLKDLMNKYPVGVTGGGGEKNKELPHDLLLDATTGRRHVEIGEWLQEYKCKECHGRESLEFLHPRLLKSKAYNTFIEAKTVVETSSMCRRVLKYNMMFSELKTPNSLL